MKRIVEHIEAVLKEAFLAAGYDEKFAKATVSNRPDLCEYQCNGAMAAAKTYQKSPHYDCKRCGGKTAEQ